MESLTNSAGNKQWLNATKNLCLIANYPHETNEDMTSSLSMTKQVLINMDGETIPKSSIIPFK